MQNAILILGLAVLAGVLVFGAFTNSGGFNNLVIEEIRFREPTSGPDIDEWITIANRTSRPVDLTGWKIESAEGSGSPPSIGQTFFFPSGCVLPPGGKVYVHSGPVLGGGTILRTQGKTSTPCNQPRIHLYVPWDDRLKNNTATGWWEGTAGLENTVWENDGDIGWLLHRTGSGLFVWERVDTCIYTGNEANGIKKCR